MSDSTGQADDHSPSGHDIAEALAAYAVLAIVFAAVALAIWWWRRKVPPIKKPRRRRMRLR